MKSISKEQLDRRTELAAKIEAAQARLLQDMNKFNEESRERYGAIEGSQRELNDLLEEVREFVDDIKLELESYYDEKSEKWQESDRGQEFYEWIGKWNMDDLYPIEVPECPELEIPTEINGEYEENLANVLREIPATLDEEE